MLQQLNKLGTSPQLQGLYLDALHALLHNKPMSSLRIDPAVADVARAQAAIGWKHLLLGRFAREWQQSHDNYLGKKASSTNNGSTWTTNMIETWFKEWLNLWKLRNEDRHGHDAATEQQAREQQTIREATIFYDNYADKVGPDHEWLFTTNLQDRLQGRISTTQIWLSTWKPIVEERYTTALNTG
jgi:hypothetical protein